MLAWVLNLGFAASEAAAVDVGAGAPTRKRYILPDGRVYIDPSEAYQALEIWTRARLAEPDLPKPKKKGSKRKSVSIKAKTPTPLMADVQLPRLVEKLPARERARIDPDLVEMAEALALQRADEEAIVVLLLTT